MKRMTTLCLLVLLAGAGAALVGTGAALAGVDVYFGANAHVGDDASLFVSISSRYFGREPRVIEDWQRRYYPDPDDLAVALFLSSNCDRDPEFFFSLRKQGVGWFEIANRCHVPVKVFFLSLESDPGPPYGNAYGHWRKYRRDHRHVMALSDDDIRHLVGARMIHEYYGVPLETAMTWRAGAHDVRSVMAREYRQRHGGHERNDGGDGRDNGGAKGGDNGGDNGGDKGHDAGGADRHNHGKEKGNEHGRGGKGR